MFVLQVGIGSFKMSECLGIHKREREREIYTIHLRCNGENTPSNIVIDGNR